MSIITLTTDSGLTDHRVASYKGTLLSLNSGVTIIDISHQVQPHNLLEASYIIRNAYAYFPKSTIHIIGIDSFYHPSRKYLLCLVDGHYFILADNGLIHLIFFDQKPESIYEITINQRFDDTVNCSIKDIFIPVANHINNGGVPEIIGRKVEQTQELILHKASYLEQEKMIVGEIMYIDHYGNAVTNIDRVLFNGQKALFENFEIKFRNIRMKKIHLNYTDIIKDYLNEKKYYGKELSLFNDAGYLEIAIYKGNKNNGAHTLFGLNLGEKVYIEFS